MQELNKGTTHGVLLTLVARMPLHARQLLQAYTVCCHTRAQESDIGINPSNDGQNIRLTIPPLTQVGG